MSDFLNKYPYTNFHELNLDWVIERVKKLTEDWAATLEEWNSTEEQWQELYDYVHDYFDNLDVQQEINNKINAMIADGTFVTITTPVIEAKVASMMPATVASQIGNTVASQIGATVASQIDDVVAGQIDSAIVSPVNDWLSLHITQPTTPVVDDTLTISGAAADSAVTGKTIRETEIQNEMLNGVMLHIMYPVGSIVNNVIGTQVTFTDTGTRAVFERVYIKYNSTIRSLNSKQFILIKVNSADIIQSISSWVTSAAMTPGYYYVLYEENITDEYIVFNNLFITVDGYLEKNSIKNYIDNADASNIHSIDVLASQTLPELRNIVKVELANTSDITAGKYYYNNSGTMEIRTGTNCNRMNNKIRLYANKSYHCENLYYGFCVVCNVDSLSVIDTLNNLLVGDVYTPTSDCELYVTFTDADLLNATIYMIFENDVFNPYIQSERLPYIVVDVNGSGQFTDIQSAIDYANNTYNTVTTPVTIFIKNGVYTVLPDAASPFYAINKGSNMISIRGEDRDHTIIRCTCTDTLQGVALNIGGQCTIENLTIENLADATYTPATILPGNHRPYCLHNDAGVVDDSVSYYTTVRNCKFYSECDTPVGAGMHENQTQRYENCEFIYSQNAVIIQQGALYVHAPINPSDTANGLEVVDCVCVCNNTQHAMSIGDVSGSQPWAQIPQTYIRNVTYSAGTELHLDGASAITDYSKLNSNSSLNK